MPADPAGPVIAGQNPRVAVVDIDRHVRIALGEVLRVAGLDVIGTAGDVSGALGLLAAGAEVLVIDPRLPDLETGHALMSNVRRDWPFVRIVIMGWGDSGESPVSQNVAAFITKSAEPEHFVAAAVAAIAR